MNERFVMWCKREDDDAGGGMVEVWAYRELKCYPAPGTPLFRVSVPEEGT